MLRIEVAGATVALLPQRAAWLPAHRALLVADVHVGKAVSFRRLGVPVPVGTTAHTLDQLARLIAAVDARRVVFLGDFLHSTRALAPATLAAVRRWRDAHAATALTLVRGNHDLRAGDPPAALDIEVVDEPLALGSLWLAHHPRPRPTGYVFAGHLHPCTVVGSRGFDRLRLPCFHIGSQVGVLPAFGGFTGMRALPRVAGDRVFVVADDAVHEV